MPSHFYLNWSISRLSATPNDFMLMKKADMCYTPASYAKPDDLALKSELFTKRKGTVSLILHGCIDLCSLLLKDTR